ncbi:ABC transporter permease [Massilia glaciei]|uniref:ABC transporter permease n=1 Tax=Massilia glaciei TaxID=1524097 RepID=UPI0011B235E8|nr:FtsX-like permease family protein [Massilia glaciei]
MLSPRWSKLRRDMQATPGRVALIVLAMAAGVCALATMLGSLAILTRETRANYLATNPPSATLQIERIDAPLLATVRAFPGIAAAQAGTTVRALIETGGGAALPLTIFVVDDFKAMRINTIRPEAGAWPPPPGALLLERDALGLAGARIGDSVRVRVGQGRARALKLAGTVHDAALPPASQGQTVYAFASADTVAGLGLDGTLRQLKLTVNERPFDADAIEATVARLAAALKRQGARIGWIRIPPPGEHPHQRIMDAVLTMLSVFGAIAVLLSAVLSATVLGGMLAQQARQIGVMKAVGASSAQIAAMYLALVGLLALAATALGGAAGLAAARAFSRVVLREMLNFTLFDDSVPHWFWLALLVAGLLVPLLIAAVPVMTASGRTAKEAMSDFGSRRDRFGAAGGPLSRLGWIDRGLLMALRNSMRRRARLLLTVGLLAAAGAMFMSSLNVRASSVQHLVQAAGQRHYDIEVMLRKPAPEARVMDVIGAQAGVLRVEPWERGATTLARADGLRIERVYPDGMHGTLLVNAVPESNGTFRPAMLDGAWLKPGQDGTAVLNSAASALNPAARVGGSIALSGKEGALTLRVVGIARQDMAGASVYVSRASYDAMSGEPGLSTPYRVVLARHDAAFVERAARRIEAALKSAGFEVGISITEAMMRKDADGHFVLLIGAMLFISALMAAVGAFGLGAAMGSSVAERGRELGIMRSIGASPGVLLRNVLCEGMFIALMSLPLALLLSVPLSALIASFLGNLLFGLPFPLALSTPAMATWCVLILCCSLIASGLPAWRASRLSVHQSLSTI